MLPWDREVETTLEAIPNLGDESLQPPLVAASPSPWEAAHASPSAALPGRTGPSEEGGVRREGPGQPEILAGQHAVHALRQRLGVGGGPGHRGAQDHLPARRRGELRLHPLPALLLPARAPQLLLQRRHGGDLRQSTATGQAAA